MCGGFVLLWIIHLKITLYRRMKFSRRKDYMSEKTSETAGA